MSTLPEPGQLVMARKRPFVVVEISPSGVREMMGGGMANARRARIKAAFQAAPSEVPVCILLATDAASEGVNLQNHCAKLIHLEIPWNPNRIEQRNGRVDRHGQKAPQADIYHFAGSGFEQVRP